MHAQEVVECIRRKGSDDILRHIELATAMRQRLPGKNEDEHAKVAVTITAGAGTSGTGGTGGAVSVAGGNGNAGDGGAVQFSSGSSTSPLP